MTGKFCISISLVAIIFNQAVINLKANDNSLPQHLGLDQFVDSAMLNHPGIKNSQLNINSISKNIMLLKPTEFIYQSGNRFSNVVDRDIEVRQNFGSPMKWFAENKINENLISEKRTEAEILKFQIISKIKSAYYLCVYESNRIELLKKLNLSCSLFQNDSSKISLLQKIILETKCTDWQSQVDMASNDFLIAKNNLLQASYINADVEPNIEELKIIEIAASKDTSARAPGKLIQSDFRNKLILAKLELKAANSNFYPELMVGYFDQTINKTGGFRGLEVGISVPLWFAPQYANREEALMKIQMANNSLQFEKFNIVRNTDRLYIELNKLFERLNYYYDFALKQADVLEETATKEYQEKTINCSEYLQSIEAAYKIRLDYLDVLNKYNQAAIELELYVY
jgi:cobalt-zinc-cadmium resistance protein CzcA